MFLRNMVRVSIIIVMGIAMRVNGSMINDMVKVP